MKRRATWITGIVALVLIAGGGAFAYVRTRGAEAQEPPEPTVETAMVTRGDIVITASGSGELISARELELSFRTSGVLGEVLVETGDRVEEGDLLAQLETDSLERALTEADTDLRIAELELADVRQGPSDAELADAQARVRDARVQLALAQDAYEEAAETDSDGSVERAKTMYDWWVGYYQSQKAKYEDGTISETEHDYAMAAMIEAEEAWERAQNQETAAEIQALKSVEQAQNALFQAEENLELLQSEPLTDTLIEAELAVDEAVLSREEARANLEAARLYAPFEGTVMDVAVGEGDRVGSTTTILTLADLEDALLQFWLEESDMDRVGAGHQVNVTFEALPDTTFTGTVVRVDPMLVTVNGTSAVQARASLHLVDRDLTTLSGMTADVEVIAAEAEDALLVPAEALEEGPDGGTIVFVVAADGQAEQRGVTVGLMDALNAEILAGLELGETVRTDG